MSDGLDITSGGAISVDSSMVRDIGRRLGQVARRLQDAADLVHRAAATCAQTPDIARMVGTGGMTGCAHRLTAMADEARDDANGVEMMADTFELVELRNEQAALSVHRPDEAMALQRRIDALLDGDPDIEKRAAMLIATWEQGRFGDIADQPWDDVVDVIVPGPPMLGLGTIGAGLLLLSHAGTMSRRGLLPYGVELKGAPPPVRLEAVGRGTVAPVASLKDAFERIPYGRAGQVVVEKYTMSDGSKRFVGYIDGTRTVIPGTDDPWDMGSNWDLYVDREQAASQVAVEKALHAAGAEPGDRVELVGYSQGAAGACFIAMEGVYDVDFVLTAGNPVEPSLASDQTLVEARHRGDVISNIAGTGSVGGTGSAASFTMHAEVEPGTPIAPHRLQEYIDTAAQADASGDPRVRDLHEALFAELGEATSVETTEFRAERP
ncbi:hypothetical protein [Microbacterium alcoholitolerans]|uniref:hypothetical protein n=1 Tax=unclassified Microbacterium TaxID=2609290 RepID=UPI003D1698A2